MGRRRVGIIDKLGRTCCRCKKYKLWVEFRLGGVSRPNICLECKKLAYPKEYDTWLWMKTRCNNPRSTNYKYWGGRGISVCEGLSKFKTFISILGGRPEGCTLDRIENDSHYSCGSCEECLSNGLTLNVRWATWDEQANNRRLRGSASKVSIKPLKGKIVAEKNFVVFFSDCEV